MNELEVKRVPFMGADLMAAKDESGDIWAGVRWMCEGIGLSKGQMQNERARIHADSVLSQGERNLVLPSKGGNQSTLCLKLDFVPLWLAKINITPAMQAETPEGRSCPSGMTTFTPSAPMWTGTPHRSWGDCTLYG